MALKRQGMHKVQDGVGTLELHADAGESLRVTRIRANDLTCALEYIEPTIDRKTVGYFRITACDLASDILMNELVATPRCAVNIFDQLKARGRPLTFPVAEGQTFRIVGAADVIIDVEHDLFDSGDVAATEVNGTESPEFFYIERGSNAAEIAIGETEHRIINSITPGEFPDFPFEGVAGARSTFEVYGIIGQPVAVCDATPAFNGATERLRLVREREILMDPDREGLLFRGDATLAVAGTEYTRIDSVVGHNLNPLDLPLFFDEPLVFEPGSELAVFATFTAAIAATAIPINTLDVGFILKEIRA